MTEADASAAQTSTVREYETIYVLRADAPKAEVDKVSARVQEVVDKEGGKLTLVESWGRRKLAYPVRKQKRGVYYYLKYLGTGIVVDELERHLRMLDPVMKYQTVKLRDDVDVGTVDVDPEHLKFEAYDPPVEDDQEDDPMRLLGLDESAGASRADEDGDDEGEDSTASQEAGGEGEGESTEESKSSEDEEE